jgi:small-conductance mechanosensitive channel
MVQISGVRRIYGICIVAAGLILAVAPVALAQDEPLTIVVRAGESDAEIKRVLDLAAQTGRSVTVQIEKAADSLTATPDAGSPATANTGKAAAPPATQTVAAAPAMEPTPEMAAANMSMASWEQFSNAILRGATIALSGLLGMSTVMGMTETGLAAEGSNYGWAAFAAVFSVTVGAAAALLLRAFAGSLLARRRRHVPRIAHKIRRFLKRLIGDLACAAVLLVTAKLVLRMLIEPETISFLIGKGVVAAAFISLLYMIVGRFLFVPDRSGSSLTSIDRPNWHFRMLVAYGVISGLLGETIRLADLLGLDRAAIDGWFLIGGTTLTVLKLVWFIGGQKSIREVFIGTNPGPIRRLIGTILPEFYIVSAVLIWLAGFLVAGTPDSARWSFAAGTTQVILLIVPILALGVHHLVDEFARHCEKMRGAGLLSSILASLRVVFSGAVWIGGLHLITAIWQPLMTGETAIATGWILWLERLSFAVVASWAVSTLIWRYFESISPTTRVALPGQEDDQAEKSPTSRLSTALPVVRNLALGTVLAVGTLLILSSLDINVAPLLAGFGVLGLALSFGSQALVKDVVSGIFFIADDAFRIGEYINTGKLQGTVEQITVRSIRLRHHNGPIHTIPFGQISSVTNYSRDWGTIKFQFRFERDANAELIRKTTKKVGLAMLEDPEFGPEFLIPLKMQGIQDITETSMIVRFKFTCLPGNPSILKREAMKRLIEAFKVAGLEFASNAVTIRSGPASPAETAAVAASMPQPLTPVAV